MASVFSRKFLVWLLAAGLALFAMAMAGLYAYAGIYGLNVFLRRGGSIWLTINPDDPRISPSMRLALRSAVTAGEPGPFSWREIAPGFDVAELPVLVESKEVDRVLLSRIDPKQFRIELHNAPSGRNDLNGWMKGLGAAFVINGGYFSRHGYPDTPFVAKRVFSGPSKYDATHGALVISKGFTGIRDLKQLDWRQAFMDADYANVSYPLLLGPEGSRTKSDYRWLANRSFVGQDRSGRLIFGTTKDAFFSLERFANFLGRAPLDLVLALNLDGGPVACQGIALNGYVRDFCGDWETATSGDKIQLLARLIGNQRWGLPMAIAAFPK
jgi:hypothetical protein